jgi:hypothetical protein
VRTDQRAALLRGVGDDSPWFDKALWHAVVALEDIAEETGTPYAMSAERGLRGIDSSLAIRAAEERAATVSATRTEEAYAARVSVLHAIGARADTLTTSIDPACRPSTPCEHVTGLAVSLGDVARCDPGELVDGLVEHAALTLCWLEAAMREQAA